MGLRGDRRDARRPLRAARRGVAPIGGRADLRRLLERAGSYGAIAAAVDWPLFAHIGEVYDRLEAAGGPDDADMAALRLAVLVHEGAPDDIRSRLQATGLSDFTPLVTAVVEGFGALWKTGSDDDLRRYVHLNRAYLAGLLLFELAHEGRSTAVMARAAELGGLTSAFERWHARLAGRRQA